MERSVPRRRRVRRRVGWYPGPRARSAKTVPAGARPATRPDGTGAGDSGCGRGRWRRRGPPIGSSSSRPLERVAGSLVRAPARGSGGFRDPPRAVPWPGTVPPSPDFWRRRVGGSLRAPHACLLDAGSPRVEHAGRHVTRGPGRQRSPAFGGASSRDRLGGRRYPTRRGHRCGGAAPVAEHHGRGRRGCHSHPRGPGHGSGSAARPRARPGRSAESRAES